MRSDLRIIEFGCLVICIALFPPLSASNCAADEDASQAQDRWSQALNSANRISARYRIERINHTFQDKITVYGECLWESERRWSVSISDSDSSTVSALSPSNDIRLRSHRVLILQNEEDYIYGNPDENFLEHLSSEKFEKALNASLSGNPLTWFAQKFSQGILRGFTAPMLFPTLLGNHPDIKLFDRKVHKSDEGRTYLILTPKPDCPFQDNYRRVDVVFEPDESLPSAIRTIDPAGTYEVRFYTTSLAMNQAASIPEDAFNLPDNILLLHPSELAKRLPQYRVE